ncbi:hypothetical protein KEM56_003088 [Ascosphaera pollenicola]|nr:hypothetical protein KEM56_003088 [Ascosphaera pollenicola]
MYNSFYSSPYGPGQGQGQQPSQQQQQPPQQMPAYTGLAPPLQQYGQQQPPPSAGSGMSFLAPQPTGFPVAPQPTGFQPPQQQQQQRGLAPAPTGFGAPPMGPPAQSLTPQYTVVPHQQPQLQPQPTAFAPPPSAPPSAGGAVAGGPAGGQTSSDIARSFTGTPAQPAPSPSQSKRAAIPQQRLSFITAADQTKFEQLFRSAVGDGQALEGKF